MYNGKTLENIQEACRSLLDVNEKIDPILYAQFRKNYIDNDLKRIFDDIEMVAEPLPDYKIEDFEEILAMPTGTQIEYIETIEEDVEEIVRKPKPLLHQTSTASSFKSGNMKNKQGKENLDGEDEFLMEFDPSGKFLKMTLPLIMKMEHKLTFDDIAGLERAKEELKEAVILPLLRPDIFQGIRSPAKGILLFGPPGTGKTFLAKVASCECNSTFFNVSASNMTSKWIGESEKQVRALFAVAKAKKPSIIFIDEIDSLLSARTEENNDHLRGLKTEFFVQLDGMMTSSNDQILVIAATNRPNSLDEAARRRFTRRIFVGLPDMTARKHIIKTLLKSEDTSLSEKDYEYLSERTNKFSSADVAELTKVAAKACIRKFGLKIGDPSFKVPPITIQDFEIALKEVNTSVSDEDVNFHLNWNKKFGSFQLPT